MKILILASNTLSYYVGCELLSGEFEVWFYPLQTHTDLIQTQGITFKKNNTINYYSTLPYINTQKTNQTNYAFDLIFVFPEGFSSELLIESVEPFVSQETIICVVESVFDQYQSFSEFYGADRILLAVPFIEMTKKNNEEIIEIFKSELFFEYLGLLNGSPAHTLCHTLFQKASIILKHLQTHTLNKLPSLNCLIAHNINHFRWLKLLSEAISPQIAFITQIKSEHLFSYPEAIDLCRSLIQEGVSLANLYGIFFTEHELKVLYDITSWLKSDLNTLTSGTSGIFSLEKITSSLQIVLRLAKNKNQPVSYFSCLYLLLSLKNKKKKQKELTKKTSLLSLDTETEQHRLTNPALIQEYVFRFILKHGDDGTYNVPICLRLASDLNILTLKKAIIQIFKVHEALRFVFLEKNDQVYFQTLPVPSIQTLPFESSETVLIPHSEETLDVLFKKSTIPFNLKHSYPIRFFLFPQSDSSFLLLIVIHHIVTDSVSHRIFMNHLVSFYEAISNNKHLSLQHPAGTYHHYAITQRKKMSPEKINTDTLWLKNRLRELMKFPIFKTDFPRPEVLFGREVSYRIQFSEQEVAEIKSLCIDTRITFFIFFSWLWALVLSSLADTKQIPIGIPVLHRSDSQIQHQIGCFMNMIAFPVEIDFNASISSNLRLAQKTFLEFVKYSHIPFEKILLELDYQHAPSYFPIYQTEFIWIDENNRPSLNQMSTKFEYEKMEFGTGFDLTLIGFQWRDIVCLSITGARQLFLPETIQALAKKLHLLAQYVVLYKNSSQSLNQLELQANILNKTPDKQ